MYDGDSWLLTYRAKKVGCPLRTSPRDGCGDVSCVSNATRANVGAVAVNEATKGGRGLLIWRRRGGVRFVCPSVNKHIVKLLFVIYIYNMKINTQYNK